MQLSAKFGAKYLTK